MRNKSPKKSISNNRWINVIGIGKSITGKKDIEKDVTRWNLNYRKAGFLLLSVISIVLLVFIFINGSQLPKQLPKTTESTESTKDLQQSSSSIPLLTPHPSVEQQNVEEQTSLIQPKPSINYVEHKPQTPKPSTITSKKDNKNAVQEEQKVNIKAVVSAPEVTIAPTQQAVIYENPYKKFAPKDKPRTKEGTFDRVEPYKDTPIFDDCSWVYMLDNEGVISRYIIANTDFPETLAKGQKISIEYIYAPYSRDKELISSIKLIH